MTGFLFQRIYLTPVCYAFRMAYLFVSIVMELICLYSSCCCCCCCCYTYDKRVWTVMWQPWIFQATVTLTSSLFVISKTAVIIKLFGLANNISYSLSQLRFLSLMAAPVLLNNANPCRNYFSSLSLRKTDLAIKHHVCQTTTSGPILVVEHRGRCL